MSVYNNEIELFDFQQDCIDYLLDKLVETTNKETIIVKSPTGSGKTIMLISLIQKYLEIDLNQNTCFVWLCPGDGELEEQSKSKMEFFAPNYNVSDIQDILLNGFSGGSTCFVNWQMITNKKNKAITESERKNLFERIEEAHRLQIRFVILIDEEHRNDTVKADNIINAFMAKNIIRVSATARKQNQYDYYEIKEKDVIESGLITRALFVNDNVENIINGNVDSEYSLLIDVAEEKRKLIAQEYISLDKNINPLVIIQFPPSSEDLIERVENKLNSIGINYANNQLSKWLSNSKINVNGIEKLDSHSKYLIMKQAISTGWDCPRAKILIKLRENMDEKFEIQTLGRLRRMPEMRHYNNNILDYCYLYTFDEKYKDEVLKSGDSFELQRVFLKNEYRNFELIKENMDKDFPFADEKDTINKIYYYFIEKYNLKKDILENKTILEDNGYIFGTKIMGRIRQGRFITFEDLSDSSNGSYINYSYEYDGHSNAIDRLHSIDVLKQIIGLSSIKTNAILKHLFHISIKNKWNLLELKNLEWSAFIINNIELLKDVFIEIASQDSQLTLDSFLVKKSEFKIPLQELYRCDNSEKDPSLYSKNVYKNYNSAMTVEGIRSKSERLFENYLEKNENVEWFYKNGDSGKSYLSIMYKENLNKRRLFYPDYIVSLKNKEIWIVECKGGEINGISKNIDKQALNKFNVLKDYARQHNLKFAFVRDKNEKLYISTTKFTESLSDDNWKPIKGIL